MYLEHYIKELTKNEYPDFIDKYLVAPSLLRLKKVGYFCGMDYASKDIYNFSEYISRFDHSLTVALLTYRLTNDKKATLAGLFHDISTPCFSHVIDYMNEDFETQESTELYTEYIIKKDKYLQKLLKQDNIDSEDIINFKKYSIVDNERPKLCTDRLDGVILTGMCWTKNITKQDITNILNSICIFNNEDNDPEIGFNNLKIAQKVLNVSKSIDIYCHSKEDNYMMQFLAKMTKYAITKGYIKYENLYYYNEEELIILLTNINDTFLQESINTFKTIKKEKIPTIESPKIKIRSLFPIVNGRRIK